MPTFTWWIDEPLVMGSSNPDERFRAQSIRIAVSLLQENKPPPSYDKKAALDAGWSIYSIPIEEGRAPSLQQIQEFITHVTDVLKGTQVLVFCESGKGRTSCMAAAYWIAKGLTAIQAIARVSEACSAKDWATPERQQVLTKSERSTKS